MAKKATLPKTVNVKISDVKSNPNNPRLIRDEKFAKLVRSIQEFPQMLALRPIIVNSDMMVLGGNMRLKACEAAGLEEVPVIQAQDLTEEQQREFIIKDNVGFGEWDWEIINNEWDSEELEHWGLDVQVFEEIEQSEEGDTIELPKSLQIIPKKEYVVIMADEDSEEWQELQEIFQCGTVRQGGCKVGSTSDRAGTGLERVFDLKTFKERVLNDFSSSDTK